MKNRFHKIVVYLNDNLALGNIVIISIKGNHDLVMEYRGYTISNQHSAHNNGIFTRTLNPLDP
jgi:hypothetical protein